MLSAPTTTALAAVRLSKSARDQADVALLLSVLDWTEENQAGDGEGFETYLDGSSEHSLALAGPGAPLIREFAAYELGAAMGMTSDAAKNYLGRALELGHRLPELYAQVLTGALQVWRATRIAEQTITLSAEAAGYVDHALAATAHKCGIAQVERTVAAALAAFDPAEAERRRLAAAEHRHFEVRLEQADLNGTDGVVHVEGCLDHADALDLEHALRSGARHLAAVGCTESLDVRRTIALGDLARRQLALDYDTDSTAGSGEKHPTSVGRSIVIHAHLHDPALTPVVGLDHTRADILIGQLKDWCTTATRVTIKPVLDLHQPHSTPAYAIPERIRSHVTLRDRHCVFPHCQRPAASCDLDHTVPWPHGETSTDNLAPLCRPHHRAKTHSPWTYTTLEPGTYLWTSPSGLHFQVDPHGTADQAEP